MDKKEQRRRKRDELSFDEIIGGASFRSTNQYHIITHGLSSLDVRPSFGDYLKKLWQRRHFIQTDARGKAYQSARDLRMGQAWLIVSPLLDAAMYGVVFGLLLQTSRGIENFIGYLTIGVIFFRMMTSGLSGGSMLIQRSRSMINSFHFPRASLVLSLGLRNLYDSIPPAIVAIIAALAMQYREPLHWTIIYVIPVFFLIHLFSMGLAFFTARMTASFPDSQAILKIVQRAWFYTSGVFFGIDRFAHVPTIHAIMEMNPGYLFLMAVRNSAIYGEALGVSDWLTLIAWSFGTFLLGMIVFWRGEEQYGRVN